MPLTMSEMKPSAELADRVRAVYAAMTAGDPDQVESMYSLTPGSVFIGTSKAEFWTDSAAHNVDVRPFWKPGNVSIEAGEIHGIQLGEVGMTIDRPKFRLRDGTVFRARLTFVWRQEQGVWKVIHSHASVGTP